MDNIDETYDRFLHILGDSSNEADSLMTIVRFVSPKTLELVCQRGGAQASSNYQLTSALAKL